MSVIAAVDMKLSQSTSLPVWSSLSLTGFHVNIRALCVPAVHQYEISFGVKAPGTDEALHRV